MSDYDIHSCGYYCDRHACIVAQRNELRDKLFGERWVKTYSGGKPNYTEPIEPEPMIDGWPLWSGLPQPEPEPVAWGVDEGEGRCISLHDLYFVKEDADHMAELKGTHAKVVALYTAPPKKEWVGLTDELFNAVLADTEALEDAKMTLEVIKKTAPDAYDEIIDSSIALIDKALSNSIMSTIANILDDENWFITKDKNYD